MKKLPCLCLAAVCSLAMLAACGAAPSSTAASVQTPAASESASAATSYKIGILQQTEHSSLDEIRAAIVAELESMAAANGATVSISYQNAQGDGGLMTTIAQQFVADDVDMIIPIATGAAQAAAATTQEIPIVFSAVADPVAAELVPSFEEVDRNATGVSHAVDVSSIFELADELTPGYETVGFLYNLSEINAVSTVNGAKAYLESRGIKTVERTVTGTAEVQQAAEALVGMCDIVFVPNDNSVVAAASSLAQVAIDANVPVYCTADSVVNDGALGTVGVNYTQVGVQTAQMAFAILSGTPITEMPAQKLAETFVTVNPDTAAALGVEVSKYSS